MGLFKRKERLDSPQLHGLLAPINTTPSPSLDSGSKSSKVRFLKGRHLHQEEKTGEELKPRLKPLLPRQISTEHHIVHHQDEDEEEFESDLDYEPHMHTWIPRDRTATVSQLSTLMGYCGLGSLDLKEALQKAANEELKRTFSLLNESYKITRLSPTMNRKDALLDASIINEPQLELINKLKEELNAVLDMQGDLPKQYAYLDQHKTLNQRYGTVKDVVGRGAYGVIKLIDSGDSQIYAVKELQKRPIPDSKRMEPSDKFIDRVISEFILSSTLNNKNIVRTVDLMVSLPPQDASVDTNAANFIEKNMKVNQVMESSNGGNLFTYLKKCVTQKHYVSIDDIDCMIKQIARGVWYMHQHGVAHCDLKLENILIDYDESSIAPDADGKKKARMNLKISDFGKSSVFRTAWDSSEQLWPASSGAIGSEPYMAPEEHGKVCKSWSLAKKDCWALGVLILVLYNVRRHYFCGASENFVVATYYDETSKEEDSRAYGSTYLWKRTDLKPLSHKKYKDSVFDEYVHNAMDADYDSKTQEWTIKKKGTFIPIETLFDKGSDDEHSNASASEDEEGFEESDYELRRLFIYKLLDMNPSTRLSVDALLTGAWLNDVESCA